MRKTNESEGLNEREKLKCNVFTNVDTIKEKGQGTTRRKWTLKRQRIGEKGITLVALVVTIIIMLILAGVALYMTLGDNGLILQARRAAFLTEVRQVQEEVELKGLNYFTNGQPELKFGTLDEVLGGENKYNEKLVIENGEIYYDKDKITEEEKKWLDGMGIKPKNHYYLIMMEDTKNTKFKDQENVGTIKEFRDSVNEGNFEYDKAYVVEDIEIEEENWTPIGPEDNQFTKILDGGNYSISGLKINSSSSNQGLFGFNKGTIQDLTIKDANITVTGEAVEGSEDSTTKRVGVLVARNAGGIIENINIEGGKVEAANVMCVAGVVGSNNSTGQIKSCENSADIRGGNEVGGISGTANGYFENCVNKGKIEEVHNNGVGGICGTGTADASQHKIINCNNLGEVTGGNNVGGIVGNIKKGDASENATVDKCINNGKISGNTSCGGIVGYGEDTNIKDCENNGNITTKESGGDGIIGKNNENSCTETNCQNHGTVSGPETAGKILRYFTLGNYKKLL